MLRFHVEPALMSVFVNPSHDLKTFDNVCVHPSHDLHFWQCVHPPHDLHIWQCLCWSISCQYCYVLLLTVFVQTSHDLQTHLTNVFISWPADAFNSVCVLPSHDQQTLLTVFVFIHLMTCRHFQQCLCPSISWPQTLLTMFVSIYLMTCRHIWQCVCPSHDLHTFDSLSPSISWPADTFDSVCVHPSYDLQTLLTMLVSIHLMTCRHFWQFLCSSSLWPADIFDSGFTSIHLMTFRHFLSCALLSLDNTTFYFSIFCKLFPGYKLILMPLLCISDTMTKTRFPRVVPKFDDARESIRALVDDKESKTAADQRARNKLTS